MNHFALSLDVLKVNDQVFRQHSKNFKSCRIYHKVLVSLLKGSTISRSFAKSLATEFTISGICSVPSRVRNLRKMRNFWANFTDFKP